MADRVDDFTAEFEAALADHRRHAEALAAIAHARKVATRLGQALEELDRLGIRVELRPSKLAALDHELEALRPASDLDSLAKKARNLVQVIDDGLVDGDATRLRELLAESVVRAPVRSDRNRAGDAHLPVPVRVRCAACASLIVGRKQPSINWNAVTKVVRDHSRDVHGEYTTTLRDELGSVLSGLRAGDTALRAGQYEFETA